MFKRSGAGNTYSSGIDYLVWRLADGNAYALRNWISKNGGNDLNEAYAPFVQKGIKQFGQGGLAVGPSHQSGMLGMTKSGSPFLFEGGEYIINKKSTQKLGTSFLNNLNSYEGGGMTPLEEYFQFFGGSPLELTYKSLDAEGKEVEITEGASGLTVSASFMWPQPVFLPSLGTGGNYVNLYDMGPYYQQKLYDITRKASLEAGIAVEAGKAARVAEHQLENAGVVIQTAIGAAMGYYFPALPFIGQAGNAAYFGYKSGHGSLPENYTPDMPSQATGGYLVGPSHAGGGILLEAEGGEYIINKKSVDKYGKGIFDSLNQGTWAGKFPTGGLATYTDLSAFSGRRDMPTEDSTGTGTSSSGLNPIGIGYGGQPLSSGAVISTSPGSMPVVDYGGQFNNEELYQGIGDYYTGISDLQKSVQMAYDVFSEIPAIGFGGGGGGMGGTLGTLEYITMEAIKQFLSNDLGQAITEFFEYPADTWKKWVDQYFPGVDLEDGLRTTVEDFKTEWDRVVDEYQLDDWITFCEEKLNEFQVGAERFVSDLEDEWEKAGLNWDEEAWKGITWGNLSGFQASASTFINGLQGTYSSAVEGWDWEGFKTAVQANIQSIVNIASNILSHAVATINSAVGSLPAMGIGFIPNPLAAGRLGGLFGNLVPNWIKSRDNLIDIQMPGGTFQNTEDLAGESKDKKEKGGILSYQEGGFALGPSHAQGGIPGIVAGKYPIEFEGGEYIINKKTVNTLGAGFFDYVNSIKAEDGFNTSLAFNNISRSRFGFGSPIREILRAFSLPSGMKVDLNAVTPPSNVFFEEGGSSLLATNFPVFNVNKKLSIDLARSLNLLKFWEDGGALDYAWGGDVPKYFNLGKVIGGIGRALTPRAPRLKAKLGFNIPSGIYASGGLHWENGGFLDEGFSYQNGGGIGYNSFGMNLISEVGSGSNLNASLLRELIYVLREKDLSVTFVDESGDEVDESSFRIRRMEELQYRRAEELA